MTEIIIGSFVLFIFILLIRQSNIKEKKRKEQQRLIEELARIEAEQKQLDNIQAFKLAEQKRVEAEQRKKVLAEQKRLDDIQAFKLAEQKRVEVEQRKKVLAEQKRLDDIQILKLVEQRKSKNERLKKIEDEKYESVLIINLYSSIVNSENFVVLKRQNNTYAYVNTTIPLTINTHLKQTKEIIANLNWLDEVIHISNYERFCLQKVKVEQENQKIELVNIAEQKLILEQKAQEAEKQRQLEQIASKKTNWLDFQKVIQNNGITKLYHFTDKENLESIRSHGGLYSWHYCKENNIIISKPGGSPTSWILDERKGLQNFVRVSFVKDHPMLFVAQNDGRITNPIVLEINQELIYNETTRYTTQNAAKNGVSASATFEEFNSVKFPILKKRYFDLSAEEKPFYQAEILILEKIPLDCILNLNNFLK